ncbi:hypothetical protein APSETT444_005778 [Aspergillus pseudonomiae]
MSNEIDAKLLSEVEFLETLKEIQRLAKFREILDDIHSVQVLYGDPMPRNMMVSLGEDERVLWIDFDSAQTFSEGGRSPRQQEWIEEEDELVDYFVDALISLNE